jgi:cell division protein FtsI (penicillin-binding protein 3)
VILVVLDEPRDGGQGGKVAAPVFREVAEGALRYLDVPASVPRRELELRSKVRLAAFSQSAPGTGSARRSATDPDERFVIPDLLGMDGRRAIARATVEGFEVRASGRGVVRRQSPSPGEQVAAGRTLELILSPMELSP